MPVGQRKMSVIVIALLGVFLAGAVAGCNQNRVEAVSLLNQGLEAEKAGKRGLAVEYLEKSMQKDPEYAKPAYILAQIHHRRYGSPEDAISYYREALSRAPENAEYAYKLGSALLETGSVQESITHFRRALDRRPNYAKAWLRLGNAQKQLGKFSEAAASYSESIRSNPTLGFEEDQKGINYHQLGRLYVRFGLHKKAEKVYRNGTKLNPNSPLLMNGLGLAIMKQGNHEEAIDVFKDVLELDSRYTSAHFNRAVAEKALGNNETAIQHLQKFLRRASRSEHGARITAANQLIDKWQSN